MRKILFLIPNLSGGGAEKVLVNLVNNMNANKYSITVMTLFNVGINIDYLNSNITYKYIFNKSFRGNIHILKLFNPNLLYKYLIKDEYDIVVSYLQGPTARIVAGCQNENTKLVNWIHNEIHEVKKLKKPYRNLKETINCHKNYDSTVFVADTARKAFQQMLPNISSNFEVLYNTVETEKIREMSLEDIKDIQIDANKTNIISVGRFAHQKGYERLLTIMNKLINEDKLDIHLYLLGKGELEEKYYELIKKYKISENVTLLGYQNNPYKYIKNCDLFVCSSYHEGFSTAVTESLIVGTPVLTTLCSGMEELLGKRGEYGYIVENNEVDLYAGLKFLINDKKEMERLREMAEKRGYSFSKTNTVKAVEHFFDSI
ncbi:glycosyltransferase [Halobacillus halophilus]|uniref:glycosyltransferase n=1 Tax=Halobacillus halophilus TaxID=1570 RepID=UPI00136F0A5D|nr:glycosyltransferase [Halobacillus halophilus]MYL30779.1 glycosyltransferase [Halobacillus halophilus]